VRWKACDEYFLDDVERESAGRRDEGLVGVHIGSKDVALPHEFVNGLL
jgi:hypothetical protein